MKGHAPSSALKTHATAARTVPSSEKCLTNDSEIENTGRPP